MDIQDLLENYLPKYSSSDDVARLHDLHRDLEGEYAFDEHNELQNKLFSQAIEVYKEEVIRNYKESQKVKKEKKTKITRSPWTFSMWYKNWKGELITNHQDFNTKKEAIRILKKYHDEGYVEATRKIYTDSAEGFKSETEKEIVFELKP